jgi:nicotinamidase-related amidase
VWPQLFGGQCGAARGGLEDCQALAARSVEVRPRRTTPGWPPPGRCPAVSGTRRGAGGGRRRQRWWVAASRCFSYARCMSATPATSWPGPVDEHIAPRLATSALLIIDTQVDFVDGGRSPIAGTTAVIPKLVELRSAFLDAGRPVIHVVRLYAGDDVDRVRRTAMASGANIVAPGSAGSQVVPELCVAGQRTPDHERLLAGEIEQLDENEWAVWKPRWSAFHRTRLHRHLADLGVDTIVVAGCNFPNCPRATIYDGSLPVHKLQRSNGWRNPRLRLQKLRSHRFH